MVGYRGWYREKEQMNRQEWERQVFASDLAPTTKLVALSYGTFSSWNRENEAVWPSKTAISDMTGLDRKTVQRHVDLLVKGGWMKPMETLTKNVQKYRLCTVVVAPVPNYTEEAVGESEVQLGNPDHSVGESCPSVVAPVPTNIEEHTNEHGNTNIEEESAVYDSSTQSISFPHLLTTKETEGLSELEKRIKHFLWSDEEIEKAYQLYLNREWKDDLSAVARASAAVNYAKMPTKTKEEDDEEW